MTKSKFETVTLPPHIYTDGELERIGTHLLNVELHFENDGKASQSNARELHRIAQSLMLTIERMKANAPVTVTKKSDAAE